MLYRISTYETWVTFASERSCICSSVAPMNMKPPAINRKGVRYWKLFGSEPSEAMEALSLSTKEISMIRAAPAAMRVYPKTVWIMVEIGRCWGCADMAQPVMRMMIPGMRLRLGCPFLFLLSQTPTSPAAHHTMPIEVCCRSLCTHGPPQRCSVKVLTQPHAAMTSESKNSWLLPVLRSHIWPTKSRIRRTMPYAMKALPMMKCAKHCPVWSPGSARQKPRAVIPPNRNCTHVTTGSAFPTTPCAFTTTFRIFPLMPFSRWSFK
jgi:hypothetical protein